MPDSVPDLSRLLSGEDLDDETIENLKAASRDEVRRLLVEYLPEREVSAILARIEEAIKKRERSR